MAEVLGYALRANPTYGVWWIRYQTWRLSMSGSPGLEAFIDESLRISRKHGYHPTAFVGMRARHGTVGAISRLVVSGDTGQSGFKRLHQLGLLEWSVEEAVTRFPDEFSREVRQAAEWRLAQARAGS
jgi:hypothetical protein